MTRFALGVAAAYLSLLVFASARMGVEVWVYGHIVNARTFMWNAPSVGFTGVRAWPLHRWVVVYYHHIDVTPPE